MPLAEILVRFEEGFACHWRQPRQPAAPTDASRRSGLELQPPLRAGMHPLRRLSVLAGSWTLEAAEAVAGYWRQARRHPSISICHRADMQDPRSEAVRTVGSVLLSAGESTFAPPSCCPWGRPSSAYRSCHWQWSHTRISRMGDRNGPAARRGDPTETRARLYPLRGYPLERAGFLLLAEPDSGRGAPSRRGCRGGRQKSCCYGFAWRSRWARPPSAGPGPQGGGETRAEPGSPPVGGADYAGAPVRRRRRAWFSAHWRS